MLEDTEGHIGAESATEETGGSAAESEGEAAVPSHSKRVAGWSCASYRVPARAHRVDRSACAFVLFASCRNHFSPASTLTEMALARICLAA